MRFGFVNSPTKKTYIIVGCITLALLFIPNRMPGQSNNIYLRLGYSAFSFQEVNPSDANAAIQIYANAFKDRIEKRLNKPVIFESKIYNSVGAMVEAISQNKLDCLSISSSEYYEIKKSKNIYPMLGVTPDNDAFQQYLLITKKDKNFQNIKELFRKKLAMPDPMYHPMSEEWLYNYLKKNNLPEQEKMFTFTNLFDKETNAVYINVVSCQLKCQAFRHPYGTPFSCAVSGTPRYSLQSCG